MKKTIYRITAALLCLMIAMMTAACGDQPKETSSDGTQPAAADQTIAVTEAAEVTEAADSGVKMTESYRAGRQAYYDVTGIWMPEVEGVEAEYDANDKQGSIAFDAKGDKVLFEAAKAVLVKELGEPRTQDEISAYWTIEAEDGSTKNYDVYYHESETDGTWVFMNFYTQRDE